MSPILIIAYVVAVLPDLKSANPHFDNDVEMRPRIVGGAEPKPHSLPYLVYLEIEDKNGLFWQCGSSLISKKYVLTAAHCLLGASKARATLGAHDISYSEPSQVKISSRKIISYPYYAEEVYKNDIGVIELEKDAPINEFIQIGKLPTRADVSKTYAHLKAIISGWGFTDGYIHLTTPVLLYAKDKLLENSECSNYYDEITDEHVCFDGKNGKLGCYGDSGGPLVVNRTIIGIAAFTDPYCASGYPTAFTRITHFLDWIEQNTDVKIK